MLTIFKYFLQNAKFKKPNYKYAMLPWILIKQGKTNISDPLMMKTTLPIHNNVTTMQKINVPSRFAYVKAGKPEIPLKSTTEINNIKLIKPTDMNSEIKNHTVIYREFCADPNCALKNCHFIDIKQCALDSLNPVVREVLGNYTSNLPEYKTGIRINAPNYSGQNKNQYIVFEDQGIIIDKKINFIEDENATNYLQRSIIYETITKKVKTSYYSETYPTEKPVAADYISSTSSKNPPAADYDQNSPKIYIDVDENN